jgi:hypothetical protein
VLLVTVGTFAAGLSKKSLAAMAFDLVCCVLRRTNGENCYRMNEANMLVGSGAERHPKAEWALLRSEHSVF